MRLLVFCLLCAIWGFSWVAIKLTLEGFPPFLGAAVRFLLAVPFLWAFAFLRRVPLGVPRRYWRAMFGTAFLTYVLDYGLTFWGAQFLSPGVTAIFFATFPIFTGILSGFLLPNEPPSFYSYSGLGLSFLGVFITFSGELDRSQADGPLAVATIALLLSALAGALATVWIKRELINLHPLTLTLWQTVLGSLLLLSIGILADRPSSIVLSSRALTGLLYLALIATALAFSLFYWLLGRCPAVTVSSIIFVTPIVALAADSLVYGHALNWKVFLGMSLVFLGILLSELPRYRPYLRRRRAG